MIEEGKIGVHEAVCLVVTAISNRIFFTAPATVARATGTAGWYMALISNLTTIVAFYFIYLLLKRFPNKNLFEIFDLSWGRFIGFILSFIYASAFLFATGTLLREFLDMLKVFVFPRTPLGALIFAVLVVIVTAAFLGFETIARVASLASYTSLAGYIILLLLAVNDYRFSNLFPILGYGLGKTVIEGLSRSSAFSEVIILAVFAGSLQGVQHIKKAGFRALIISGLIISSGILCITMAFSYANFQEQTAPLFVMVRFIKYGPFFQRIDPLFLLLWIISAIIASSTLFYSAVSSYCKTFRLLDARPVIIPMAVLLFAITLIPRDFPSLIDKYIETLRIYPIFLFYCVPFTTLIVAMVRQKKGKTANA
ncbi:MAG: GerAB/ArcD/ProY family transporter [Candidatus Saccharibacteria bacterium]